MASELNLRLLRSLEQLRENALTWDDDRKGHDPRYADHLADAARYGVMKIRALYKPETEKPKPGSPEWLAQQDEQERADKFRRAEERRRRESQAILRRYSR